MKMAPSSVTINADDFGISPGVNRAIIECYTRGNLNTTSILANGRFFDEAIQLRMAHCPELPVGMHINLCYGQSVLSAMEIPLLVDAAGTFKYGFSGLLLRSLFPTRAWREQITKEIQAQCAKVVATGIQPQHIDGHRHVQLIPVVCHAVTAAMRTYEITRLRVINEPLWRTLNIAWQTRTLFPLSGILKYIALRILTLCCGVKSTVRFFSILFTCALQPQLLEAILKTTELVEVMVHPGLPDLDREIMRGDAEYPGLMAHYRDQERLMLLTEQR